MLANGKTTSGMVKELIHGRTETGTTVNGKKTKRTARELFG